MAAIIDRIELWSANPKSDPLIYIVTKRGRRSCYALTQEQLEAFARLVKDSIIPGEEEHPALTAEQLAAVQSFAAPRGGRWKRELRTMWEASEYLGFPDASTLQQLRNSHGPAWLAGFTIPQEIRQ